MIYTVTLNPSLDYLAFTKDFRAGKINRALRTSFYAGGKGINVSSYLHRCGIPSVALGFLAGFTGAQIKDLMVQSGIKERMIFLKDGNSRINVKIKGGTETELNGEGPVITDDDLKKLFELIDKTERNDILIMSGSVPPSLPSDIYKMIAERACQNGILTVIDAEGKLLLDTLPAHPFLIKPNDNELSDMLGIKIDTFEDALEGAAVLRSKGALNVIVSMGSKGAVLLTVEDERYICEAAEGEVINSVGAGDCLLAGFIAEYIKSSDFGISLTRAVAAGCACAFSEGIPSKEEALKLEESLRAVKL